MAKRITDKLALAHAMCARIGADYAADENAEDWSARVAAFEPVGDLRRAARGWVDYLEVRPSGNFGNNYIQLLHALTAAEAAGVYRVTHPFGWFDTGAPARDLRLVRRRKTPPDQAGLAGAFFLTSNIRAVRDARAETLVRISDEFLAPRLAVAPTEAAPLVLNLRGGEDVFANPAPNGRYGQPPLAFYQMAVRNILGRHGAMPVAVVHQDELNPVLRPLAEWLAAEGAPARLISGGPERDAAALLGARHLVMGKTTFTAALAMMAPGLESLTVFRDPPLRDMLALKVPALYRVDDAGKGYFSPSRWRNSDRQRRMMIDYPESALTIADVARSGDMRKARAEGRALRRAGRLRRRLAQLRLTRP